MDGPPRPRLPESVPQSLCSASVSAATQAPTAATSSSTTCRRSSPTRRSSRCSSPLATSSQPKSLLTGPPIRASVSVRIRSNRYSMARSCQTLKQGTVWDGGRHLWLPWANMRNPDCPRDQNSRLPHTRCGPGLLSLQKPAASPFLLSPHLAEAQEGVSGFQRVRLRRLWASSARPLGEEREHSPPPRCRSH